jgi:hypothetical protein
MGGVGAINPNFEKCQPLQYIVLVRGYSTRCCSQRRLAFAAQAQEVIYERNRLGTRAIWSPLQMVFTSTYILGLNPLNV